MGTAVGFGASPLWKELGCCGVMGVAGVGVVGGGASASPEGVAATLAVEFFLLGR